MVPDNQDLVPRQRRQDLVDGGDRWPHGDVAEADDEVGLGDRLLPGLEERLAHPRR